MPIQEIIGNYNVIPRIKIMGKDFSQAIYVGSWSKVSLLTVRFVFEVSITCQ